MKQHPDIFLFNPTCEYAVANGKASWQPNRLLQKMETDLATLPQFFAQSCDIVLTENLPSSEFIHSFDQLECQLPQFFKKHDFIKEAEIKPNELNRLVPWGWSVATHKLLSPLKKHCSYEFKSSPVFNWKPESKELYSKRFALEVLTKLLSELHYDFLLPGHLLTEVCTTQSEIEKVISKWGNVMIKAPWSCSGRGLQPITKTPVHPKVWERITGIINDQRFVIAEPYLNKVADLAFEFKVEKGRVDFCGISNFFTDNKGQYQGNYIHGIPNEYDNDTVTFLKSLPDILVKPIIKTLESSKLSLLYEGNFGVDMLIFRDEKNRLKVNPCLEINLRQNMGLLALQLEKLVSPDKTAIYRMFYQQGKSFLEFKNEMTKKHPPVFVNRKLYSGFFALTEANENTQFGAYILT